MSETRLPTTHWRTREGEVLAISEMANSHLRNTIAFLEREYGCDACLLEEDMACGYQPRGEMAAMAYEQEMDALYRRTTLTGTLLLPQYEEMLAEAERRGIGTEAAGRWRAGRELA